MELANDIINSNSFSRFYVSVLKLNINLNNTYCTDRPQNISCTCGEFFCPGLVEKQSTATSRSFSPVDFVTLCRH